MAGKSARPTEDSLFRVLPYKPKSTTTRKRTRRPAAGGKIVAFSINAPHNIHIHFRCHWVTADGQGGI